MVETTTTTMSLWKYCASLVCKRELPTIIYGGHGGPWEAICFLVTRDWFSTKLCTGEFSQEGWKMKLGFQVRLTGAAFLWTLFVSLRLVGSPSGAFLNPWRGLRPGPCSGWKGIGSPAALIGACTCSPQPPRRLDSGAVCVHLISSMNTGTLHSLLARMCWKGSKRLGYSLLSGEEEPFTLQEGGILSLANISSVFWSNLFWTQEDLPR